MAIDILTEFQQAQQDEASKRQNKADAEAQLPTVKLDAIQPLLDVREALSDVVVDSGYPVAKAFYTIPERPEALFCLLSNAPQFESVPSITNEGNLILQVAVIEAGNFVRTESPDGAASYLIRWIAQHEQVDK